MSLVNFINKNQGTQRAPATQGSSGSLVNFIDNRQRQQSIGSSTGGVFKSTTKKEEADKSLWQKISKQLMKPVGSVAAEVEGLGKFIGGGGGYIPGKGIIDVLSGQREYSFSKLMEENYVKPMQQAGASGAALNAGRAMGFITDLAADPLNFIGGGLTKLGKLANKVTSLNKSGKKIKEGSKIYNQIKKAGYTVEQLELAGTKLEQAEKGQRAFLQAFGKPIIKGTKLYEKTGSLNKYLRATPGFQKVKNLFSSKTGIPAFDKMIDNYKNLGEFRKQSVIDNAVKIQNDLSGFSADKLKMVAEVIERPEVRNTIVDKKIVKVADNIESLFNDMKVTEKSKDILKSELENYFPHIKIKEKGLKGTLNALFNPRAWSAKAGFSKERKIAGTVDEINSFFGKEFFQSNPTLAYAQRGLGSAKAVTAKEFLEEVGTKFFKADADAPIRYVESTNPIFKGMKAEPEIVNAVDQYVKGIQPEELKAIVRGFDAVQNWWKAQVLISPSYHTRNMVGNFWNNWLAGVKNPAQYFKAKQVQKLNGAKSRIDDTIKIFTDSGEAYSGTKILNEAKKNGVVGKGLYGAEIQASINDEITGSAVGIAKSLKTLKGWNPFSQENALIKTNRAVGSAIEDNARMAHFIDMVEKGFSFEDAGRSVKKFLFDYTDLTWAEKNIMKRVAPFYTWTSKNLPLQIENLVAQPAKYAMVPKAIEQIESGSPEPATEKYMSDYIKNNIPVRIRQDKDGNYEYFMLGNWLPSASAIDFLSQPIENSINMVSPIVKTPIELWANKSMFFKNTLGEPSEIEYYHKQPTEFVGIAMRKKAAHLARNIRVLNDMNNFIKKGDKDDPKNSLIVKVLNLFFGKSTTMDISKSKTYYDRDTQQRVQELEASIKNAKRSGQKEHAKDLYEELKKFRKSRQ